MFEVFLIEKILILFLPVNECELNIMEISCLSNSPLVYNTVTIQLPFKIPTKDYIHTI